jgi:23S rRNA pseudouridine1911/1915/1917 synthase
MSRLSQTGGELRPGIVHRLDKETSGAIVIAKDDVTHRELSEMFSDRRVTKNYLALVHGALAKDNVTVDLPIARDLVRRTRMTTRRADGRHAISHVHVLERLNTHYGPFTLVQARIETGRTHQIRVHMQSLGHPVVGDTLYGAPRLLRRDNSNVRLREGAAAEPESTPLELHRNFLHAAHLEFEHPRTRKLVSLDAPLPEELQEFITWLRSVASAPRSCSRQSTTVG